MIKYYGSQPHTAYIENTDHTSNTMSNTDSYRCTEEVNLLVDQILPGLYRLEIPIPNSPLKAINSYIIKGDGRHLIIDTGLNQAECLSAMRSGLNELSVDLSCSDFFITHMHADHMGLLPTLKTASSTVYASRPDADTIVAFANDEGWTKMRDYACLNGFPADEADLAIQRHPGRQYGPHGELEFTFVEQGSSITMGAYQFTCIETPGHTKGHLCLYEQQKKILISGDHILGDITPNISLWSDTGNPLDTFLQSLDKVASLPVDLVLPGHRRLFQDCPTRIDQLKAHHQRRADETRAILAGGCMTAFEVAANMTWEMTYKTFSHFPAAQKWFATGEVLAHLRYLEAQGLVRREMREGKTVYCL